MANRVDSYVSFSDQKNLIASPLFKSFHQPTIEPNAFTIDQRDIEEERVKQVSTAATPDSKKSKRTTNPSDANYNAIVQCDICQVPITSQIVYDTHIKGKKHLNLLSIRVKANPEFQVLTYVELCSRKPEPTTVNTECDKPVTSTTSLPGAEPSVATVKTLECQLCNVSCNSEAMFENHIAGKKHQAKLKMSNLAKPSAARAVPDNNPSSSNYCDICSVRFKSENDLTEHLAQKRHQTRVKEADFCAKEAAEMNINFDDYKLTASDVESSSFDYHCQACNKKFKNKVQLIEHLKSVLHTRLTSRPVFSKPNREAPKVPRGGIVSRGGTKRLAQHAPFPRGMVRPSRESRSNPVETAPWKQQGSQSFGRSPPMNADLFGAFSEDEQAKFLSNSTSYAQSTEYTDYSSEYDGFYPKRFRADHHTDDYSRHYPPPPPSSAWQYQAEPYYNTPASSQYSNPIYYPPNPPLPNYDPPPPPPPPPSYPPSAPYANTTIGNQEHNLFYSNNYSY